MSHNKTLLLYHMVCPAKYRRKVFTEEVEQTLKKDTQICFIDFLIWVRS